LFDRLHYDNELYAGDGKKNKIQKKVVERERKKKEE